MEKKDCAAGANCCLECGEPLSGRCDKKFCGDYCRNAYNNRLHVSERRLMEGVNRKLAKNHKVLEKAAGPWSRLSELEKEGFAKSFFTGSRGYGICRTYECYDIRYRIAFGYLMKL